jgi:hypothetical protein
MLPIIGALITLAVVVIIPRLWVPRHVRDGQLGWMSERWLAQYRAMNHT